MEDERYDSELERQLREAAEGLRMEPSDRVWAGISEHLHPRRRRFFWWGSAAATLTLIVAIGLYLGRQPARQPMGQHEGAEQAHAPVAGKEVQKKGGDQADSKVNAPEPVTPGTSSLPTPPTVRVQQANLRVPHPQRAVANFSLPLSLPVLQGLEAQAHGLTPGKPYGPELVSPLKQAPQVSKPPEPVPIAVKTHPKLSFSLFFSPSSGYRILHETPTTPASLMPSAPTTPSSNPPSLSAAPPVEKRGPSQHPAFSWVLGVRTELSLGSHAYLQTGVSLQQANYRVLTYGAYPAYSLSGSARRPNMFLATNAIAAAAIQHGTYRTNSYLQAEVPVMAGWRFGDPDRIHVSVAAGAGISYLLHSDPLVYSPKSDRYLTDKDLIRPVNSLLHLETAVHLPLGHHAAVSLGPSIQYQLGSSYRNFDEVKEHPYLIGIAAGLHWRR